MYRISSPARWLLVLALALGALASTVPAAAQVPTFDTCIATPTNSSFNFPESAAVGDFNGDGNLDALVTDGATSLRLMLGNGNGTFAQHDVNVPGTNPGPIKAADFNGDGRLDAVLTSNGTGNATVLLNVGNALNGVPQFAASNYPGGGRSVTAGDLNGDGWPDFILGSAFGFLFVYLNDGNGAFTAGQVTTIFPGVGPSVGPGVIADLNGDGKADFVVTSTQAGHTSIFFGNGDGTLQGSPVAIPVHAFGAAVADLNGDGRPDLIQALGGALLVHLNDGTGTFGTFTSYAQGSGSVAAGDVNGDGHVDVVGGYNVVRLGDGTGALGAPYVFPAAAGSNPRDVAVGDFNNDGKLDIGTVGRDNRTYGVMLNSTVFVAPATMFFTDALTGNSSPNLAAFPAGNYGYTASGLQRIQSSSTTDRPMVTTALGTYLTANNFTAEITVDLTSPDLAYFGFGRTEPDPLYFNEPVPSFIFRVHNNWQGYSGIQAWPTTFGTGFNDPSHFFGFPPGNSLPDYSGGPLTLMITKSGDTLTMSIPSLGASKTFSISQYAAAMGLTGSNARIFFGPAPARCSPT